MFLVFIVVVVGLAVVVAVVDVGACVVVASVGMTVLCLHFSCLAMAELRSYPFHRNS